MLKFFMGWPVWLYALLAGGALVAAGSAGWTIRGWQCDAAQLRAEKKEDKREEKNRDKVQVEAKEFETEKIIAGQTERARREQYGKIYKDTGVPDGCAVPDTARRVLEQSVTEANSRAGSEFSEPLPEATHAPEPDDGPSSSRMGG